MKAPQNLLWWTSHPPTCPPPPPEPCTGTGHISEGSGNQTIDQPTSKSQLDYHLKLVKNSLLTFVGSADSEKLTNPVPHLKFAIVRNFFRLTNMLEFYKLWWKFKSIKSPVAMIHLLFAIGILLQLCRPRNRPPWQMWQLELGFTHLLDKPTWLWYKVEKWQSGLLIYLNSFQVLIFVKPGFKSFLHPLCYRFTLRATSFL